MPMPEGADDAKHVPRHPSPSKLAAQRIHVLLQSAHEDNIITAALEFQQLAKTDTAVALAADLLHHFVAMLRAEQLPIQAAAAAALAGLCTTWNGRDAARLCGALQQLVLVVQEQQKDPGCAAAEHAAKALMNAAACDAAKVTIHRAGGVPCLMQLLRCGLRPRQGKPCPAAVYAVGALLNMVLVKKIQATLLKLDGMALLEDVAAQHCGNVLGMRAHAAVGLLQSQLSTSHFQAAEGAPGEAGAEAAADATHAAGDTVSSDSPSRFDRPAAVNVAVPEVCEGEAGEAAATAALPSAAGFAASFAASFAAAELMQVSAAQTSEGGMPDKESSSTQPEVPAAAGACRTVTFDIPSGGQTPVLPSAEASSASAPADGAVAATSDSTRTKHGSSKSLSSAAGPGAKKSVAPHAALHSHAAAKRTVGKATGLSPRGLVPKQDWAGSAAAATQRRNCRQD